MSDTGPKQEKPSEILIGLHDKPPAFESFLAALQHLMAIFIGIITPPLIIGGRFSFRRI